MKNYNREQGEIAHMKEYIAKYGHGSAKLARQAKSREKQIQKLQEGGLTEKVVKVCVVIARLMARTRSSRFISSLAALSLPQCSCLMV